jgi:hypothetical protein
MGDSRMRGGVVVVVVVAAAVAAQRSSSTASHTIVICTALLAHLPCWLSARALQHTESSSHNATTFSTVSQLTAPLRRWLSAFLGCGTLLSAERNITSRWQLLNLCVGPWPRRLPPARPVL